MNGATLKTFVNTLMIGIAGSIVAAYFWEGWIKPAVMPDGHAPSVFHWLNDPLPAPPEVAGAEFGLPPWISVPIAKFGRPVFLVVTLLTFFCLVKHVFATCSPAWYAIACVLCVPASFFAGFLAVASIPLAKWVVPPFLVLAFVVTAVGWKDRHKRSLWDGRPLQ